LTQLAQEARKKLADIDAALTGQVNAVSPSELITREGQLATTPQITQWREQLAETFRQYDRVADDYREVPGLSGELKGHVARERRRSEVALVLNEPEAKDLLEVARQHEADGNACCAYWVYRQAVALVPSPSARLAETRFAELEQDPKVVAAAKACRELQQCHQLYNRAERLAKVDPDRAKELLAQIVARAPKDSELYAAVQRQLQP
jgi:hypothetical protein